MSDLMNGMSKGTLAIGMFSRASSISIKALRAYHEAGILVPARVDPDSGYRIYAADQLADAAIVARLRALDVPLAQVKEILHGRDPELTRRILEAHQTQMRQRLADTQRIIEELQSGVTPVTHTRCTFATTGARHRAHDGSRHARHLRSMADARVRSLLRATSTLPAYAQQVHRARCGAGNSARRTRTRRSVPFQWRTGGELHREQRPRSRHRGRRAPRASVAVLVHPGEYTAMPDTYRTLGAWVARNAPTPAARIREWCVVGPGRVAASAYRTEIAWPISRQQINERRR